MVVKLEELLYAFFIEKFHIQVVEQVNYIKLRLLWNVLPKNEHFSFLQQNTRRLQILIELLLECFVDFIDNFWVAISKFVNQSIDDHPPELAMLSQWSQHLYRLFLDKAYRRHKQILDTLNEFYVEVLDMMLNVKGNQVR